MPSNDPNRTTLLILGTDNLDNANPRLLAVWRLSFNLLGDEIVLFGLPIDASLQSSGQPTLQEAFDLERDHSPTEEFLSVLSMVSPHYSDVIIVLDEEAFAQLVDFMGGAWLDGEIFNGQEIVASLRFMSNDPDLLLALQASLLLSLSYQSGQLGESPEITVLTDLVPEHAYSSMPPTALVNLLIPLLPLNPDAIQIEVWSLDHPLP